MAAPDERRIALAVAQVVAEHGNRNRDGLTGAELGTLFYDSPQYLSLPLMKRGFLKGKLRKVCSAHPDILLFDGDAACCKVHSKLVGNSGSDPPDGQRRSRSQESNAAAAFRDFLAASDARVRDCADRRIFDETYRRWRKARQSDGEPHCGSPSSCLHHMKKARMVVTRESGSVVLFRFGPRARAAEAAETVRQRRAEIEADKYGMRVVGDAMFNDVIPRGGDAERTLRLRNCGDTHITFKRVHLLDTRSGSFACTVAALDSSATALHSSKDVPIPPGGGLAVIVRCNPVPPGMLRSMLSMEFCLAGTSGPSINFAIGRYIEARAGDAELLELMKPIAEYRRPRRRKRVQQHRRIDDGERPDLGKPPRWVVRLRHYNIDPAFSKALVKGDADEWLERDSSTPLGPGNYPRLYQRLLWCEENQHQRDIRAFDMHAVTLGVCGLFLKLKVPGLAESRPSVLRGDHVEVTMSGAGQASETRYIGYAHRIDREEVWLKFSRAFHGAYVSGQRVDVQFTLNGRTPMRVFHQGLEFAARRLHEFILFPPRTVQVVDRAEAETTVAAVGNLNEAQQCAVRNIVESRVTEPVPYVIFGPPGTGKTTTVVAAAYARHLARPHEKILLTAPSNSAADLLVEKLAAPPHSVVGTNMMVRVMAFSRDIRTVSNDVRAFAHVNNDTFTFPPLDKLTSAPFVVATLSTAGKLYNNGVPEGHFDSIFIDEAGHALEPEAVCASAPLLKCNSGGRLVLAGDPQQLGPIVVSETARAHGLGRSLLQRIIECPLYGRGPDGAYNPAVMTKLVCNYRSHPAILDVPNRLFYDHELQPCSADEICRVLQDWEHLKDMRRHQPGTPVVFHAVEGKDMREANSPSWFNPDEATAVLDYVKLLVHETRCNGCRPEDIGIVTPYWRQVQKLRMLLRAADDRDAGLSRIKVGSVELFQGQERRVIIISTVRSSSNFIDFDVRHNLGFVSNPKRFNVAITRAQALLIVIGNPRVLSTDPNWRCYVEYCHERGSCAGMTFEIGSHASDIRNRRNDLRKERDTCDAIDRMMLSNGADSDASEDYVNVDSDEDYVDVGITSHISHSTQQAIGFVPRHED